MLTFHDSNAVTLCEDLHKAKLSINATYRFASGRTLGLALVGRVKIRLWSGPKTFVGLSVRDWRIGEIIGSEDRFRWHMIFLGKGNPIVVKSISMYYLAIQAEINILASHAK